MKKIIMLFFGCLGAFGAFGETKTLVIDFKDGDTVCKSEEFQYTGGKICVALSDQPQWVDFVEFCPGGAEHKIESGSSSLSWSSSVSQSCAFKVKVKSNEGGSEREWSFSVNNENGVAIYKVVVRQSADAKMKSREDCGVSEVTDNGDVVFCFDACGGVLKSTPTKYNSGEWRIDTSNMPEWIEWIKISSILGETTLPGKNLSGGKNIYSCSVNGSIDFFFIVRVASNGTKSQRSWSVNVCDELGKILFSITISQSVGVDVVAVKFASGQDGAGTMVDMDCAPGKVYRLTKNAFTCDGKRFAGWMGSDGKRYDDEMLVFNLGKAGEVLTLTAIWE